MEKAKNIFEIRKYKNIQNLYPVAAKQIYILFVVVVQMTTVEFEQVYWVAPHMVNMLVTTLIFHGVRRFSYTYN